MKAVRAVCILAVCGLALASRAETETVRGPDAAQIAAKPELVVAAVRNMDTDHAATVVVGALEAILGSDWSDEKKRERCIALITYAEAARGKEAASLMALVMRRVPAAWRPLVAATAVVAAGSASPDVAKAILEAVAGDPASVEACRAACATPSSILLPTEMGLVRGIMLPTPSQAPAKAPPLPTIIRPAEKYPGQ